MFLLTANPKRLKPNLDDALTGGQWQPHEAGVINGHNLVPNTEFSRTSCRAAVQHTGQNDSGQNGAPTRLHNHHTEALPFLFLHIQLKQKEGISSSFKAHSEFHMPMIIIFMRFHYSHFCEDESISHCLHFTCSQMKSVAPLYSCLSLRNGRGHRGTFPGS